MINRAKGEEGIILPIVNRAAVVLEPAQAYLEWARKCPEAIPDLTLKELGQEGTVYLIPETDADPEKWLRRNYDACLNMSWMPGIRTGPSGPRSAPLRFLRSFLKCCPARW
jgi:hypothetical protein